MTSLPLEANAAATLAEWHGLIARRDLSGLPRLLHPDAVFRSPMAHKPYAGAPVVSMILNTVLTVFEDFAYHRQLASADGRSVVLEFSARVGERELKGIDDDPLRRRRPDRRLRSDGPSHERPPGPRRGDGPAPGLLSGREQGLRR